jgi:hypothetical protein
VSGLRRRESRSRTAVAFPLNWSSGSGRLPGTSQRLVGLGGWYSDERLVFPGHRTRVSPQTSSLVTSVPLFGTLCPSAIARS